MKRGVWILKWGVLGIIFLGVIGILTQFLWNWLIPALFNGPVINYWQSLGLLLLAKILFSGFSGRKGHCSHCQHGGNSFWKQRYDAKVASMNPEDREAFKKKMMEKWCKVPQAEKEGDSSANG